MMEIKVGQTWSSKYGPKRLVTIVKKLNKACWEIENADGTSNDIITTENLQREYNFQRKK